MIPLAVLQSDISLECTLIFLKQLDATLAIHGQDGSGKDDFYYICLVL